VGEIPHNAPQSDRIRFRVAGRVQGVGFRAYTVRAASLKGLSGWVRNTWDGRVEGEAEGPPDALSAFVVDLRQGPGTSFVEHLAVDPLPALGDTSAFRMSPDTQSDPRSDTYGAPKVIRSGG